MRLVVEQVALGQVSFELFCFLLKVMTFVFPYGLILSEGRAGESWEAWKKQCPFEDWEHWEENSISIFSVLKRTSGYCLWVFSSMFLLFPSTCNKFSFSFHPLLLFISSSHSSVCSLSSFLPNNLTVNYERFCICPC